MAITSGFYNALNHDRQYEATQIGSIFDGIIEDGIYETIGQKFMVTASGNGLVVNVGTGRAWFDHTWTLNDAILPIEMDEAELVLDRIDAVVLEVDASLSGRTNAVKTVKGTPSSNPVKPTLINTEEVHQYPLAYVSIKAEQTLIEQSDIENAVGTSATPFVIGVMEMMDVDALVAQWQTQFENMMRDDQQDFTNWEILTKAAYEAWFAGVQAQMEEDIADFEGWEQTTKTAFDAWFQNLQDELDDNQAAHLQRQIGNLNALATSAKSDLVSAINEVNGRITTSVSEILIDYDESMVGVEITLSHTASAEGHTPESYTRTLVEPEPGMPYEIEVDVKNLGEWVISWTHEGESYTETLDVHYYGYYHVVLHEGFTWREWVVAGGISILKHDSLASLLADEKDVRQLFTKHASVNYMVNKGTANSTECQTIINNDTCAKWINLNDYALDYLYTNVGIKSLMDTADKYFYGEWAYDGTSWGPKGNVPVMTSDTTPYGKATAYTTYSTYYPWKAFDGDSETAYSSTNGSVTWLDYQFVNPVAVKKIYLKLRGQNTSQILIQCSDDGSTYVTKHDCTSEEISAIYDGAFVKFDNDEYHLHWRIQSTHGTSGGGMSYYTLQFYGRELKVSVPTMTSNTAPYGVVSASSVHSSGNYPAWKAFDGTSNPWLSEATTNSANIGYTFVRPVIIKKIGFTNRQFVWNTVKLQGSNDNETWIDIHTMSNLSADVVHYFDVDNDSEYLSYRLDAVAANNEVSAYEIQFYGKDYSEKEFANDGSKWLYDHGVELEEFESYKGDVSGVAEKHGDELYCETKGTSTTVAWYTSNDMTNYSKLFGRVGKELVFSTDNIYISIRQTASGSLLAYSAFNVNSDRVLALDISGFNGSYLAQVCATYTNKIMTCSELWLE